VPQELYGGHDGFAALQRQGFNRDASQVGRTRSNRFEIAEPLGERLVALTAADEAEHHQSHGTSVGAHRVIMPSRSRLPPGTAPTLLRGPRADSSTYPRSVPASLQFHALALAADGRHNRGAIERACEELGLPVVELDGDLDARLVEDARTALRLPVGLATRACKQGLQVHLSAAPPSWFAALPPAITGRRLAVVTVAQLEQGDVPFAQIRLVKLANSKYRSFAATRVSDAGQALTAVRAAGLPDLSELLVADNYLECDSEYRTFTVDRKVVASSPYLVEGESWSPQLTLHRASFHDEAAAFVQDLLQQLPESEVAPSCVLDVARLPSGEYRLLEVNTSWGAGLYGCDPAGVLQSVLAANLSTDTRWRWRPDPGLLELVPER